jgi:hypothetical protein
VYEAEVRHPQQELAATATVRRDAPTGRAERFLIWSGGQEGMGNWRFSLTEILDLAVATDRTLVLPCVAAGRVKFDCRPGTLPMSSYVDVDRLRRTYSIPIREYKPFRKANKRTLGMATRCLIAADLATQPSNIGRLGIEHHCNLIVGRAVPATPISVTGRQPTADFAEGTRHDRVVILMWYRSGAITAARQHAATSTGRHASSASVHAVDFAPSCYTATDRIRAQMGLARRYFAFHWRSERSGCDYEECGAVLASNMKRISVAFERKQTALREHARQESFSPIEADFPSTCLFVSDIPAGKGGLWGVFAKHELQQPEKVADMKAALNYLGVYNTGSSTGCRKLDVHLNASNVDIGLLSIYDQILAVGADEFYTCNDDSSRLCRACARTKSSFGAEILASRNLLARPSSNKWTGKARH